MGRYISDELFHFVGFKRPCDHAKNFEVLRSILSSKCIAHEPPYSGWGPVRVQINWGANLSAGDMIVPDMVCFCDIPFEHLEIHTNKYGHFGLSLHKSYVIDHDARPVTYVPLWRGDLSGPSGRTLLKDVEATYRGLRNVLVANLTKNERSGKRKLGHEPTTHAEVVEAVDSVLLRDVLGFLKAYDSDLPDTHKDYTYAEREWRRLGKILFQPTHVNHIVVADGYVERLEKEFPVFRGRVKVAPNSAS